MQTLFTLKFQSTLQGCLLSLKLTNVLNITIDHSNFRETVQTLSDAASSSTSFIISFFLFIFIKLWISSAQVWQSSLVDN